MEFTKDIYFNDSLKNGKPATITYTGELFRSGSEHVNIVYGFGESWHNTTTSAMQKTENGFVANVDMIDYDTFNFCFSNEHNIWDNNNSFNYISPILPSINEIETNIESQSELEFKAELASEIENELSLDIEPESIETSTNVDINFGEDYSSSIDDIIEDILGNTVQNSIANSNEANSIDKILESITGETLPEIEELFDELFSAEFECKTPINEIKEEKNNIENTTVTSSVSNDVNAELIELFNELFADADTNATTNTISEITTENTEASKASEIIENITTENVTTSSATTKSNSENTLNVASFNLDGLVSELLEPVISKASIIEENEISLFDDIREKENDEETSLTVIDSQDLLVSSKRLSSFYKFKKKIKVACYKLFIKMPKQIAKEFWYGHS